jgi:tryptophan 6-halogenase
MAANLFSHHWPDAAITLVESPEVGIIGVGEGSTPQLRAFFQTLGIAEQDWMPRCNATYKNGIRFNNWSERPGYKSYFHPFLTAVDPHSLPAFYYNTRARRTGRDVWAHPDRFSLSAHLSNNGLGPIAQESFPFDVSYGYHFDAYLVGEMLRDYAVSRGVTHFEGHVDAVVRAENGAVDHLLCRGGDQVSADIFIDCSGFRGTIIQQALGEPFIPFHENLFNDRAVALPTPPKPDINAHTSATALSAGWVWDIPLTNRTGNGYVYASSHLSLDAAETELRTHLGLLNADVSARHLQMNVGRVARSWVHNVLAVGLSQGFIEPLEATALHIVQTTVEHFITVFAGEADGTKESHARDAFNAQIADRYEGIRDYIVAHYRLNGRTDTQYWKDNANNQALSSNLKAMMTSWFRGEDISATIAALGIGGYYGPVSWHSIFAGYGTFPDDAKMTAPGNDITRHNMDEIDMFMRRCALNFVDHKTLLDRL